MLVQRKRQPTTTAVAASGIRLVKDNIHFTIYYHINSSKSHTEIYIHDRRHSKLIFFFLKFLGTVNDITSSYELTFTLVV